MAFYSYTYGLADGSAPLTRSYWAHTFSIETVEPLEPPPETHPPTGGDYGNTTGGEVQLVVRGGTPEQPLRGGTPQVSIRAGTYDETATGGEVL